MKLMPVIPLWLIVIICVGIIALFVWCIIGKKRRTIDNFRRIGILLIMVLLLLRPVFHGGYSEAQLTNLNVYFLVDLTNSMVAKDCENGEMRRFEKVKQDIKDVARQFPGAQYAVVAQDISTYVAMPLSTSLDSLNTYADALWPKSESLSRGTSSANLLEKALEQISDYDKEHPERVNVLFFMSDGEDTSTSTSSSYAQLKKHVATGAVLGYGTKDGAPLQKISYLDPKEFYDSFITEGGYLDKHHLSKIDETNLNSIASQLGFKYYNRTNGSLAENFNAEVTNNVEITGIQDVDAYFEIYWIVALAFIALLLWDLSVTLMRVLQEREVK